MKRNENFPSAVIFDCDGVLADTEPIYFRTWSIILSEFGYSPGQKDAIDSLGRSFSDVRNIYARKVPALPPVERLRSTFDPTFISLLKSTLRPMPDAVRLARLLHSSNVPLAVASSSPRNRLDVTLDVLGISNLFEFTVAGDEVSSHKPSPTPYLDAAAGIHVAPFRCIAIEDSPAGVSSAKAAGMYTVAVQRELGVDLTHADIVVDDLSPLMTQLSRSEG